MTTEEQMEDKALEVPGSQLIQLFGCLEITRDGYFSPRQTVMFDGVRLKPGDRLMKVKNINVVPQIYAHELLKNTCYGQNDRDRLGEEFIPVELTIERQQPFVDDENHRKRLNKRAGMRTMKFADGDTLPAKEEDPENPFDHRGETELELAIDEAKDFHYIQVSWEELRILHNKFHDVFAFEKGTNKMFFNQDWNPDIEGGSWRLGDVEIKRYDYLRFIKIKDVKTPVTASKRFFEEIIAHFNDDAFVTVTMSVPKNEDRKNMEKRRGRGDDACTELVFQCLSRFKFCETLIQRNITSAIALFHMFKMVIMCFDVFSDYWVVVIWYNSNNYNWASIQCFFIGIAGLTSFFSSQFRNTDMSFKLGCIHVPSFVLQFFYAILVIMGAGPAFHILLFLYVKFMSIRGRKTRFGITDNGDLVFTAPNLDQYRVFAFLEGMLETLPCLALQLYVIFWRLDIMGTGFDTVVLFLSMLIGVGNMCITFSTNLLHSRGDSINLRTMILCGLVMWVCFWDMIFRIWTVSYLFALLIPKDYRFGSSGGECVQLCERLDYSDQPTCASMGTVRNTGSCLACLNKGFLTQEGSGYRFGFNVCMQKGRDQCISSSNSYCRWVDRGKYCVFDPCMKRAEAACETDEFGFFGCCKWLTEHHSNQQKCIRVEKWGDGSDAWFLTRQTVPDRCWSYGRRSLAWKGIQNLEETNYREVPKIAKHPGLPNIEHRKMRNGRRNLMVDDRSRNMLRIENDSGPTREVEFQIIEYGKLHNERRDLNVDDSCAKSTFVDRHHWAIESEWEIQQVSPTGTGCNGNTLTVQGIYECALLCDRCTTCMQWAVNIYSSGSIACYMTEADPVYVENSNWITGPRCSGAAVMYNTSISSTGYCFDVNGTAIDNNIHTTYTSTEQCREACLDQESCNYFMYRYDDQADDFHICALFASCCYRQGTTSHNYRGIIYEVADIIYPESCTASTTFAEYTFLGHGFCGQNSNGGVTDVSHYYRDNVNTLDECRDRCTYDSYCTGFAYNSSRCITYVNDFTNNDQDWVHGEVVLTNKLFVEATWWDNLSGDQSAYSCYRANATYFQNFVGYCDGTDTTFTIFSASDITECYSNCFDDPTTYSGCAFTASTTANPTTECLLYTGTVTGGQGDTGTSCVGTRSRTFVGEYVISANGATSCPDGYAFIRDETACDIARLVLGIAKWKGTTSTSNNRGSYCWVGQGGSANYNLDGNAYGSTYSESGASLICQASPGFTVACERTSSCTVGEWVADGNTFTGDSGQVGAWIEYNFGTYKALDKMWFKNRAGVNDDNAISEIMIMFDDTSSFNVTLETESTWVDMKGKNSSSARVYVSSVYSPGQVGNVGAEEIVFYSQRYYCPVQCRSCKSETTNAFLNMCLTGCTTENYCVSEYNDNVVLDCTGCVDEPDQFASAFTCDGSCVQNPAPTGGDAHWYVDAAGRDVCTWFLSEAFRCATNLRQYKNGGYDCRGCIHQIPGYENYLFLGFIRCSGHTTLISSSSQVADAVSCMDQCSDNTDCTAFDYNVQTLGCQLYSGRATTQPLDATDSGTYRCFNYDNADFIISTTVSSNLDTFPPNTWVANVTVSYQGVVSNFEEISLSGAGTIESNVTIQKKMTASITVSSIVETDTSVCVVSGPSSKTIIEQGGMINGDASARLQFAITCFGPPTKFPSASPSDKPSTSPSRTPSSTPSTSTPSVAPSRTPSKTPSKVPTTTQPSVSPSDRPSLQPIKDPTISPSTAAPSTQPTARPSSNPTTEQPSQHPTTSRPSLSPSTSQPTSFPTTCFPSKFPSTSPSCGPSCSPSYAPTTDQPSTSPSYGPSTVPTTSVPSTAPSANPSLKPSVHPSPYPTNGEPTVTPSENPSGSPTTCQPSTYPSSAPSTGPSVQPSAHPSVNPSRNPTRRPSTTIPSQAPSCGPTGRPTFSPVEHVTCYYFSIVEGQAASVIYDGSDITFHDKGYFEMSFPNNGRKPDSWGRRTGYNSSVCSPYVALADASIDQAIDTNADECSLLLSQCYEAFLMEDPESIRINANNRFSPRFYNSSCHINFRGVEHDWGTELFTECVRNSIINRNLENGQSSISEQFSCNLHTFFQDGGDCGGVLHYSDGTQISEMTQTDICNTVEQIEVSYLTDCIFNSRFRTCMEKEDANAIQDCIKNVRFSSEHVSLSDSPCTVNKQSNACQDSGGGTMLTEFFDYCTQTMEYSTEFLSEESADLAASTTWADFCTSDCSLPESLDEPDVAGLQLYWFPLYFVMWMFHIFVPHWQKFRRQNHGPIWNVLCCRGKGKTKMEVFQRNLGEIMTPTTTEWKKRLYFAVVPFPLAIASTMSMTALIGHMIWVRRTEMYSNWVVVFEMLVRIMFGALMIQKARINQDRYGTDLVGQPSAWFVNRALIPFIMPAFIAIVSLLFLTMYFEPHIFKPRPLRDLNKDNRRIRKALEEDDRTVKFDKETDIGKETAEDLERLAINERAQCLDIGAFVVLSKENGKGDELGKVLRIEKMLERHEFTSKREGKKKRKFRKDVKKVQIIKGDNAGQVLFVSITDREANKGVYTIINHVTGWRRGHCKVDEDGIEEIDLFLNGETEAEKRLYEEIKIQVVVTLPNGEERQVHPSQIRFASVTEANRQPVTLNHIWDDKASVEFKDTGRIEEVYIRDLEFTQTRVPKYVFRAQITGEQEVVQFSKMWTAASSEWDPSNAASMQMMRSVNASEGLMLTRASTEMLDFAALVNVKSDDEDYSPFSPDVVGEGEEDLPLKLQAHVHSDGSSYLMTPDLIVTTPGIGTPRMDPKTPFPGTPKTPYPDRESVRRSSSVLQIQASERSRADTVGADSLKMAKPTFFQKHNQKDQQRREFRRLPHYIHVENLGRYSGLYEIELEEIEDDFIKHTFFQPDGFTLHYAQDLNEDWRVTGFDEKDLCRDTGINEHWKIVEIGGKPIQEFESVGDIRMTLEYFEESLEVTFQRPCLPQLTNGRAAYRMRNGNAVFRYHSVHGLWVLDDQSSQVMKSAQYEHVAEGVYAIIDHEQVYHNIGFPFKTSSYVRRVTAHALRHAGVKESHVKVLGWDEDEESTSNEISFHVQITTDDEKQTKGIHDIINRQAFGQYILSKMRQRFENIKLRKITNIEITEFGILCLKSESPDLLTANGSKEINYPEKDVVEEGSNSGCLSCVVGGKDGNEKLEERRSSLFEVKKFRQDWKNLVIEDGREKWKLIHREVPMHVKRLFVPVELRDTVWINGIEGEVTSIAEDGRVWVELVTGSVTSFYNRGAKKNLIDQSEKHIEHDHELSFIRGPLPSGTREKRGLTKKRRISAFDLDLKAEEAMQYSDSESENLEITLKHRFKRKKMMQRDKFVEKKFVQMFGVDEFRDLIAIASLENPKVNENLIYGLPNTMTKFYIAINRLIIRKGKSLESNELEGVDITPYSVLEKIMADGNRMFVKVVSLKQTQGWRNVRHENIKGWVSMVSKKGYPLVVDALDVAFDWEDKLKDKLITVHNFVGDVDFDNPSFDVMHTSKFYVTSQKLFVREGKSLNTKILYTLPQNSVVENLHFSDDRMLVRIMSLKQEGNQDKWKNVVSQNLTGWISLKNALGYPLVCDVLEAAFTWWEHDEVRSAMGLQKERASRPKLDDGEIREARAVMAHCALEGENFKVERTNRAVFFELIESDSEDYSPMSFFDTNRGRRTSRLVTGGYVPFTPDPRVSRRLSGIHPLPNKTGEQYAESDTDSTNTSESVSGYVKFSPSPMPSRDRKQDLTKDNWAGYAMKKSPPRQPKKKQQGYLSIPNFLQARSTGSSGISSGYEPFTPGADYSPMTPGAQVGESFAFDSNSKLARNSVWDGYADSPKTVAKIPAVTKMQAFNHRKESNIHEYAPFSPGSQEIDIFDNPDNFEFMNSKTSKKHFTKQNSTVSELSESISTGSTSDGSSYSESEEVIVRRKVVVEETVRKTRRRRSSKVENSISTSSFGDNKGTFKRKKRHRTEIAKEETTSRMQVHDERPRTRAKKVIDVTPAIQAHAHKPTTSRKKLRFSNHVSFSDSELSSIDLHPVKLSAFVHFCKANKKLYDFFLKKYGRRFTFGNMKSVMLNCFQIFSKKTKQNLPPREVLDDFCTMWKRRALALHGSNRPISSEKISNKDFEKMIDALSDDI